MTFYIAANGDKYNVAYNFDSGDIVLLSSFGHKGSHRSEGQAAFRIEKAALAKASPVFRDMFANDALSGAEINLEVNSKVLSSFLEYLTGGQKTDRRRLVWIYNREFNRAIYDLARLYQCSEPLQQILRAVSLEDLAAARFNTLIVACETNDLLAGCRVIRGAWRGEGGKVDKGSSLLPHNWLRNDVRAEGLSLEWFWALTSAVKLADELFKLQGDGARPAKEYWTVVAGEFMARLDENAA